MLTAAGPSRGHLAAAAARSARHTCTSRLATARPMRPYAWRQGVLGRRAKSTGAAMPSETHSEKNTTVMEEKAKKAISIAEADEALRQRLLDRDGGSASVATVNGQWEPGMGRETARQMFRVLDQARVNRPGTNVAAGEGESKGWSRRNGY